MKLRIAYSVVLLACLALPGRLPVAGAQEVDMPQEPLATLRPEHPRLIATAEDFQKVLAALDEDRAIRTWYDRIRSAADELLDEPPSEYEIPDGVRLLSVSRRVKDRTYVLALVYRVESLRGNPNAERYKDRLWAELSAAAGFKDWNPSHFLDTAEMAHGVAIGLDWLWDDWTPQQRRTLIDAIVEKGLDPGLAVYEKGGWWTDSAYNWNQVCNGGLILGALAVADEHPEKAEQVIRYAVESLPKALATYGRDGAWEEGPGYWNYATLYTVYALAGLQSALGHDFGLSDRDNLANAWRFPQHFVGPSGRVFNFADAGTGWRGSSCLWWLAERYDAPQAARLQHEWANANTGPLDLLWGVRHAPAPIQPPPLDMLFRDGGVMFMRSAFDDPKAHWLAIKAGRNGVNHGQLDLGSFIFEADGVRWFIDPGADNYNLPSYFGAKRWTYYRNRTEGHNTLVINPDESGGQDLKARAEVTQFTPGERSPRAEIDLSAAYDRSVRRHFVFLDRDTVVLTDVIQGEEPADVWWFAHTAADVEVAEDGRSATLRQGGTTLKVLLTLPTDARLQVMDAAPLETSPNPEGQNPNGNIRKLAIHLEDVKDATIEVRMVPEG